MGGSFWCAVLEWDGDELLLEVDNDLTCSPLKYCDVIRDEIRHLLDHCV